MNISIEVIIAKLNEAIADKDGVRTLGFILKLKDAVRTDPKAVKWIADPSNLQALHTSLTENLGVPAKAMLLKNRIDNRQKRAHLFVEAIENGVRRTI